MQIALLSISRCSLKLRSCHTCKFLALPRLVHHLPLCMLLFFWSSNEVPQTHKPGTQMKDASSLLIKPERRSCHSLRNDSNEKDKEPPCEFVRWLTPFKFYVCYLWRRTVYVRRVSRTRDPQGCSNNVISIPTGGACNWYVVWLPPWIPAYSTHDQCRPGETCCRLNVQNLERWAAVATKSCVCIQFPCCRNPPLHSALTLMHFLSGVKKQKQITCVFLILNWDHSCRNSSPWGVVLGSSYFSDRANELEKCSPLRQHQVIKHLLWHWQEFLSCL